MEEERKDREIPALAARYHMARAEDVRLCQEIQMERARGKRYQPIGDILVELGFLTSYQVKRLRDIEAFQKVRAEEASWAERGVKEGLFTPRTLAQVRSDQSRRFWKEGAIKPLRDLLTEGSHLSGEQADLLVRGPSGGEGPQGEGPEMVREFARCTVRISQWRWRGKGGEGPGADRVAVMRVRGDVDANNSNEIQELLDEWVGKGYLRMVVDLKETEFVSSAGLGMLVSASKLLSTRKGGMKFSGMAPSIRKVIEYLGFAIFFEDHPTVREAVEAFG